MESHSHRSGRDLFVRVSTGRVEHEHTPLAGTMMTIPLRVKVTEWLEGCGGDTATVIGILMPLLTQGKVRLQSEETYERVELFPEAPLDYASAEAKVAEYLDGSARGGDESEAVAEDEPDEPPVTSMREEPATPASTGCILPPDEMFVVSRSHGALLRAVTDGRTATLTMLLQQEETIANEPYGRGWTPLMVASWNGHLDAVRMLVSHQAMVDARTDGGLTSLMMAASRGHESVVQFLLVQGANPRALDENFKTALMWSAQQGHVAIARLLLAKNVDVKARNSRGMSALDYAVREGHRDMIAVLKAAGAGA